MPFERGARTDTPQAAHAMAPQSRTTFQEAPNRRLVHLMTIARQRSTPQNCAAIVEELLHGSAVLLVPIAPRVEGQQGTTFTHVGTHDGKTQLLAFTGEAAVLSFGEGYICVGSFPAATFLAYCMGHGIHGIVLDPTTPNEVYIQLGAE